MGPTFGELCLGLSRCKVKVALPGCALGTADRSAGHDLHRVPGPSASDSKYEQELPSSAERTIVIERPDADAELRSAA